MEPEMSKWEKWLTRVYEITGTIYSAIKPMLLPLALFMGCATLLIHFAPEVKYRPLTKTQATLDSLEQRVTILKWRVDSLICADSLRRVAEDSTRVRWLRVQAKLDSASIWLEEFSKEFPWIDRDVRERLQEGQ